MNRLRRLALRAVPPLGRIAAQRDQLRSDNEALRDQLGGPSREALLLRAELAALEANPRRFFVERYIHEGSPSVARELVFEDQQDRLAAIRHHRFSRLGEPVFDGAAKIAEGDEDAELVERIIAAYGKSVSDEFYGPLWRIMHEPTVPIHDALISADRAAVTQILRHPDTNMLFHGFENIYSGASTHSYLGWQRNYADRCKDVIVRLAEALGVLRVENPEARDAADNITIDTERVVRHIEDALGTDLRFVPVQSGFIGLAVADGVVNERAAHGAYGAHRVSQLLPDARHRRVLEIGAGLGYLAHTAYRIGYHDYTIIDLPMTAVAQAYFLGQMLGHDKVLLEGETADDSPERIKIRSPRHLRESDDRFDLVVNVDSIPEMGRDVATDYAHRIFEHSNALLSINHELNEFTVNELFDPRQFSIDRRPFWLRNGYVEEIVRPRTVPQ
jgi:hypothetical protein